MTFHIIPWMWGVDGDKTCGISDTIHITDEGCESFFAMDRDFTVKSGEGGDIAQLSAQRAKQKKPDKKSPVADSDKTQQS